MINFKIHNCKSAVALMVKLNPSLNLSLCPIPYIYELEDPSILHEKNPTLPSPKPSSKVVLSSKLLQFV